MKLYKKKKYVSCFSIPFKLVTNDEKIDEQEFEFVADQAYQAACQHMVFANGKFDYDNNQFFGVVAVRDKKPYVFVTKDSFIIETIPFDTRVSMDEGNVYLQGIFAVEKNSLDKYYEMQQKFENYIKKDLLQNINKQIKSYEQIKTYLV